MHAGCHEIKISFANTLGQAPHEFSFSTEDAFGVAAEVTRRMLGSQSTSSRRWLPIWPDRSVELVSLFCILPPSFALQRLHRIDARSTPSGHPAGEQRHHRQDERHGHECQWVRRFDFKQQTLEHSC